MKIDFDEIYHQWLKLFVSSTSKIKPSIDYFISFVHFKLHFFIIEGKRIEKLERRNVTSISWNTHIMKYNSTKVRK